MDMLKMKQEIQEVVQYLLQVQLYQTVYLIALVLQKLEKEKLSV